VKTSVWEKIYSDKCMCMLMPTDSIKEIQNAVTIIHEDCE